GPAMGRFRSSRRRPSRPSFGDPCDLTLRDRTERWREAFFAIGMALRFPSRATLEASLTTDADRSSFFITLVVVDVLSGLSDAISGPYIVLFLVDEARLGPLSVSAILTARALSGIAFGTAFGAWVDRRTSVAPLLIALGGSTLGYGLLASTTNFALLLI